MDLLAKAWKKAPRPELMREVLVAPSMEWTAGEAGPWIAALAPLALEGSTGPPEPIQSAMPPTYSRRFLYPRFSSRLTACAPRCQVGPPQYTAISRRGSGRIALALDGISASGRFTEP